VGFLYIVIEDFSSLISPHFLGCIRVQDYFTVYQEEKWTRVTKTLSRTIVDF
jgi:hypothetical protein